MVIVQEPKVQTSDVGMTVRYTCIGISKVRDNQQVCVAHVSARPPVTPPQCLSVCRFAVSAILRSISTQLSLYLSATHTEIIPTHLALVNG